MQANIFSLQPRLIQLVNLNYPLFIHFLLISYISCNVDVLYKIIFSNTLDLFWTRTLFWNEYLTTNDLVTGLSTFLLTKSKFVWNLMYQSDAPWKLSKTILFSSKQDPVLCVTTQREVDILTLKFLILIMLVVCKVSLLNESYKRGKGCQGKKRVRVKIKDREGCWHHLKPEILKGEVSLYRWPPVWLVWNQLHDNWQFLFLFAKQTNPNQSNRRSMVQWYFPL